MAMKIETADAIAELRWLMTLMTGDEKHTDAATSTLDVLYVLYGLRAKGLAAQRVVVLTGDAELNEGSNWEAILHAGARALDNLTLVVIDNRSSTVAMGDVADKLAAFGWDAFTVDGRDHDELRAALSHRGEAPTAVVAVIDERRCA